MPASLKVGWLAGVSLLPTCLRLAEANLLPSCKRRKERNGKKRKERKERKTQTQTQTQTHTDTQTHTHTNTDTNTDIHTRTDTNARSVKRLPFSLCLLLPGLNYALIYRKPKFKSAKASLEEAAEKGACIALPASP